MAIIKSSGVTPTEQTLAELCERSFLKLWSYPNPYKDDGKELCDPIAVFENDVFLFFDREGRHLDDEADDVLVSWDRWKRKVIDDQVRTAHGAEKYIRSGRAIFLDGKRQVPFPLQVPVENLSIHKIIIAHGAKEACERFSKDNVFGSLAIAYGRHGSNQFQFPFMVEIDAINPVHIF